MQVSETDADGIICGSDEGNRRTQGARGLDNVRRDLLRMVQQRPTVTLKDALLVLLAVSVAVQLTEVEPAT